MTLLLPAPLHVSVHVAVPAQLTEHELVHVMSHDAVPWQLTEPDSPTDTVQSLLPSHVTLALWPASRWHVLEPPQCALHESPQRPAHAGASVQLRSQLCVVASHAEPAQAAPPPLPPAPELVEPFPPHAIEPSTRTRKSDFMR